MEKAFWAKKSFADIGIQTRNPLQSAVAALTSIQGLSSYVSYSSVIQALDNLRARSLF